MFNRVRGKEEIQDKVWVIERRDYVKKGKQVREK